MQYQSVVSDFFLQVFSWISFLAPLFWLFSGRSCCSRLSLCRAVLPAELLRSLFLSLCRAVLPAELLQLLFQLLFVVCRKHTSSISILQIRTTSLFMGKGVSHHQCKRISLSLSLSLMHTLIRHATYRFPQGLLHDNLRPAISGRRSHRLHISALTRV